MAKLLILLVLVLLAAVSSAKAVTPPGPFVPPCSSGTSCPLKMSGNGGMLDMTVSPPVLYGTNVNGELNPLAYPGVDIGAQINAAMASAPSGATIKIPPGTYSFSTTIQCPTSSWNYYILAGAGSPRNSDGLPSDSGGNTWLMYTGNSAAINDVTTNTAYQNRKGCELRDLAVDGHGAGTSAMAFQFGGTEYTRLTNVLIQNFTHLAGINIDNYPGLWTERVQTQNLTLGNNSVGMWLHCESGCSPSHAHENLEAYVNVESGQYAVMIDGGTTTTGSTIKLNGNMEPAGGTGGALVYVAANALAFATQWTFGVECNRTAGCTRFKVDAGSDVGGTLTLSTNHLTPAGAWTDAIAGTNELVGYVAMAGYTSMTADSMVVGSPAHNGPTGGDLGPGSINTGSGYFMNGAQIACGGAPSVTAGGGVLQPGSNSFSGTITGLAASGNVLKMGCPCQHNPVAQMVDVTGGNVQYTARTVNSITFNASAGHAVDYQLSCN
jgi:hypothetical protein